MVLKASYPGVVKGIGWNSILLFSWKGISWELQLWEVIGIQIGRGKLQIRLFGLVSTPLKKPDTKNGWKHWKTQGQLRLRRHHSIPSDPVTFPYSNLISQWKENIHACSRALASQSIPLRLCIQCQGRRLKIPTERGLWEEVSENKHGTGSGGKLSKVVLGPVGSSCI